MVETLTVVATVKLHAGVNVNSDLTDPNFVTFINQAEGQIAMESKVDWVNIYSTLSDNYKKCLEMAASMLAANFAIKYDPFSYLSIAEAQTIMDANNYYYEKAMSKLKEMQYSDFLKNGDS